MDQGHGRLTALYLWSDNCSAQFKCRFVIFNLPHPHTPLVFSQTLLVSPLSFYSDTTTVGVPNSFRSLVLDGFPITISLRHTGKVFVTVKVAMSRTSCRKLCWLESIWEAVKSSTNIFWLIVLMLPIAHSVSLTDIYARIENTNFWTTMNISLNRCYSQPQQKGIPLFHGRELPPSPCFRIAQNWRWHQMSSQFCNNK